AAQDSVSYRRRPCRLFSMQSLRMSPLQEFSLTAFCKCRALTSRLFFAHAESSPPPQSHSQFHPVPRPLKLAPLFSPSSNRRVFRQSFRRSIETPSSSSRSLASETES